MRVPRRRDAENERREKRLIFALLGGFLGASAPRRLGARMPSQWRQLSTPRRSHSSSSRAKPQSDNCLCMDVSIYRLRQRDILALCVMGLLLLGIVMVQSASMSVTGKLGWGWTDFGLRHAMFA